MQENTFEAIDILDFSIVHAMKKDHKLISSIAM
jgi:hypothetical protein